MCGRGGVQGEAFSTFHHSKPLLALNVRLTAPLQPRNLLLSWCAKVFGGVSFSGGEPLEMTFKCEPWLARRFCC